MKFFTIALASLCALPTAAFAGYGQSGYSNQCFREVYREEYTPGTIDNPGRIRRWTETVEVQCHGHSTGTTVIQEDPFPISNRPVHTHTNVDNNSCIEGAIIGGILGGAGGAAASRGPDMAWAIPVGVVGGSLIGCQVDGG